MKKIVYSLVLVLILLVSMSGFVKAEMLTLNVSSNKDNVDINDEITITVDWKQPMQAADYVLNFDQGKFKFVSSDVDETFYKVDNSKLKMVWVSVDDTDKTKMTFKFKAIKSGKAKFSATVDGGFATGELVVPESYKMGDTIVNVNLTGIEKFGGIVIAVIVIAVILGFVSSRKRF